MSSEQRSFTAFNFQQFLEEGKLMASRCRDCQRIYLPVRAICPECHKDNLEWVELSGKGELAAYTAVYIGPTFMNEEGFGRDRPYLTGIVKLEEGPSISARLIDLDSSDPGQVAIGTHLTFAPVKIGQGEEQRAQLGFRADIPAEA